MAAFLPRKTADKEILVDTDESVTTLNNIIYTDLSDEKRPMLQPSRQYTYIEEADKGMLAIDGEVEFCFTPDGENFTWKVLVAPIGDDGLLGMDFLCAT